MATMKQMPSWTAKLLEPFHASPRKSWCLVGLAILLVSLWLKMLGGTHGPATAHAASAPETMTSALTLPNNQSLPLRHGASDTNSLQLWARQEIVPVKRNLFFAPMDLYPTEDSRHSDITMVGEGFWDRLAKSVSARADQEQQRQVLVNNLKTQAASLKLQSIMMGGQPTAIVNGEMVKQGSVVAGFRVLTIEARRMIIEREGIKLEILMN